MDKKGQGALEYLLLIGGAVLIAAIVISILASLSSGSKDTISSGSSKVDTAVQNLESQIDNP